MYKPLDKHDALKRYFGHSSFRDGQERLIDAILSGRDAFGVMPTGGGKSICYQLPALMLGGVALVVSPLISLMRDQVMALKNAGVSAAFVNSSLNAEQFKAVYRNIRAGQYKIVYVAPERLDGESFVSICQNLDISLVAIDEAHCISQWGQDFRPSYLRITGFLEKLSRRPVLAAFTATATAQVRGDIVAMLKLRSPLCVTTGFDRPNLYFEVLRPSRKAPSLHALVAQRRDRSGIVYCSTRKTVEKLCDALRYDGFPATRYHAGLTDRERLQNQEDFLYDRAAVMVATNAFGMGIDKSNVGYVIHYNMPKSLEAYYQEAGRAGRDGEKADCILLYSSGDIQTAKYFIENPGENEDLTEDERRAVTQRDYKLLDAMIGYCKSDGCLREYILNYFGQSHGRSCGNCGNCRAAYESRDITEQAQMILSCVKRIRDKLGYPVGAALVVRTLCGSADRRVMELGLHGLSTYGLLRGAPKTQVRELVESLESRGYIRTDPEHGGVNLTSEAGRVLYGGEKVEISVRKVPISSAAPEKSRANRVAAPFVDTEGAEGKLLAALRALRSNLAHQESIPAYIVFSNATLADMAARAPRDMAQFLQVPGVGEVKAERYGQAFLDVIAKYADAGE
ncbi:MAG: DNA helicase RecQ [Oscillospiraceae bacterium]|jgi:ATP-dependent DNA helicase RecQ|nr:DNA helicase RecQ [Oscillospiraceae bacterium]